MANEYVNKVIYGGDTLIDLTSDTVVESNVHSGVTFHKADGSTATGTNTWDSDTTDATVTVAEMISGKTAYARGSKITGTMTNNGAVSGTISTKDEAYTVPIGYHDGSGTVGISSTEQAKIIAENIRSGISILGVTGTMSGTEAVNAQTRSVTPTTSAQSILPETGYNYLAQVNVAAIPYTETDNAAGGVTATIG